MSITKDKTRKILVSLLCILLVFTMIPTVSAPVYAADYTKVADTSTLDGWKNVFGDPQSGNISTENAGKVWTDKSVIDGNITTGGTTVSKDGENSFLVALSAMGSNTSVSGEANVPTDTMLILDVSGSMNDDYGNNNMAKAMVDAANTTIASLLEANPYSRIGVVVYSGASASSTNSNAAVLILPLNRYNTAADKKYLQYVKDSSWGSTTEYVYVDPDTRIAATNTALPRNYKEVVGATYIQKGVIMAMEQLIASSTTTTVTDPVLGTVKRKPVMVLLSDGAPSLSTTNFTEPGQYNLGNGSANSASAAQVFVNQLTAAYAKNQIEDKYDNSALFYTLGLGVGNNQYARSVLQPSNSIEAVNELWQRYNALSEGSTLTVQGSGNNARSVTKISAKLNQNYVTKYENVTNMTADELSNAFKNIVSDIQLQSRYLPTLVSRDEALDGYVSFIDNIGEYMNVSDIKGIMIHDDLFSGADIASNFVPGGGELGVGATPTELGHEFLESIATRLGITYGEAADLINAAYNAGQLSYTNANDYSNYVGWYANAQDEYLGFWDENSNVSAPSGAKYKVKSYSYLGEVDEEHGVTKSNMMYVTVRHRIEIATGNETIAFAVPAALLPVVTYEVSLDEDENLESLRMTGATAPIRLVYEVSLDAGINELTLGDIVSDEYLQDNQNKQTGEVYFYTNQYEKDQQVGYGKVNTYSYFNPSKVNELYYYTEDEIVYSDRNGTVYKGSASPEDAGGTYYRTQTVFKKNGNTLSKDVVYRKIMDDVLHTATPSDGSWIIHNGTVHTDLERFITYKNPENPSFKGNTDTLSFVAKPYVDTYGHALDESGYSYIIGSTLGNNGRITITPVTGLEISKDVQVENTNNSAPDTFVFTIKGEDADANNTYTAIKVAADGDETDTTVAFDADAKATVELKDGESIIIKGMAAGNKYEVTEAQTKYYKLVSVDGDRNAEKAEITTQAGNIIKTEFVNTARGEGSVTLTKNVDHKLMNEPSSLANKTFKMNVTLEGIGVANAEFAVIDSLNQISKVNTDADGKFSVELKDKQQIRITGLPEGTVVKVAEEDQGDAFDVSYVDNGTTGDGNVTVDAGELESVVIVNKYEPAQVYPVNVELGGTKTVKNQDGTTVNQWSDNYVFNVVLQRFDKDTNKWITVDTKTVDKDNQSFTFDMSKEVYDEPGSYSYQVFEKEPAVGESDRVDGIIYDTTWHTFTVYVDDEGLDGDLDIVRIHSEHADKDFEMVDGKYTITNDFTNVQSTQIPALVTIDIQKKLINDSGSGRVSLAGYGFELYTDAGCTNAANDIENVLKVERAATDAVGEGRVDIVLYKTTKDNEDKPYVFYLKEVPGAIGEMTYDSTVVKVEITVDNNPTVTGALVAEVKYFDADGNALDSSKFTSDNELIFTNEYKVDPITYPIDFVSKKLTGRDMKAGEFIFELTGEGVTIAGENAAANDGDTADVTFEKELSFSKVGTYYYDIVETSANENGVTVDKNIYHVVVTVVDDNGTLKASHVVTNTVQDTVLFENTYEPQPTTWELDGEKSLEGKDLAGRDFTFKMAEANSDGTVKNGGQTWSATNNKNGSFAFPEITFDEAGTYYYLVTEDDPKLDYIEFDDAKFLVKVVVEDDGKGVLSKTVTITEDGNDAELKFENKYVIVNPTRVQFQGQKTLEHKALEADAFEFELYKSNANWGTGEKIGESVKNSEDGTFSFPEIDYDKAGQYYYLVKETIPSGAVNNVANGITYDNTVYHIRVDVTDDQRGTLTSTVHIYDENDIPQGNLGFTNTYNTSPATVTGLSFEKTLTGRAMADKEFEFHLVDNASGELIKEFFNDATAAGTADTIAIGDLVFDEEGEYAYRLYEIPPLGAVDGVKDGVTYTGEYFVIEIKVVDNGSGQLVVESKTIKNSAGTAVDEDAMSFENVYNTTPVEEDVIVGVTKTLTGRDLSADEFEFQLKDVTSADENDHKVIQTKKNGQATNGVATVDFDPIKYNAAGTYKYQISEVKGDKKGVTYSEVIYDVTVVVTDNGKGGFTVADAVYKLNGQSADPNFTNSYEAAPVDVTITAEKELKDLALKAGMFDFVLKNTSAPSGVALKADQTVANGNVAGGAAKEIAFDKITLDKVGTYVFTVNEVQPTDLTDGVKEGITYDTSVITVTIEVTDNTQTGKLEASVSYAENGTAVNEIKFTNDYDAKPVKVEIKAKKVFTGGNLTAGQFSFELYEGNKKIGQTVTNDADGNIVFDEIKYDAVGTHEYTVKEVAGNDPTIKYDLEGKTVKVVVSDNEKGNLVAEVNEKASDNQETVQFTNYDPEDLVLDVNTAININKTLNGRDMAKGEFEFELKLVEKPSKAVDKEEWNQTKSNAEAKDGVASTVVFENLNFDVEGEYVFEITEKGGDLDDKGVTYDETKYRATITVTDVNNVLTADVQLAKVGSAGSAASAAFVNTYEAAPYTLDFLTALNKELTGRDLVEGEFTFKLVNTVRPESIKDEDIKADWKWNQTIANLAPREDGKAAIDFDAVTFPEAGDYEFEVYEVDGGKGGVTYSEDVFVYKMTIVDSQNGQLEDRGVTCELKDGNYTGQTFKNTYNATDGVYTLEGTKTLYGAKLKDKMFEFQLYEASVEDGTWTRGKLVETVQNDADGKFAFEEQVYTEEGTYYYIVVESTDDPRECVTYDKTVYLVQVDVTDNGEGKLVAKDTIQKKVTKTVVEEIVFNNVFVTNTPKTGDDKNLGLWTAVLALCASGFAGLTILKKKEDEEAEA